MKHALALLAIALPLPALGVQTAAVCDKVALQAAQIHNVPPQVMMAIARVESGRNLDGTVLPWPWAVNRAGTSHWFDTANEAYAFVQSEIDAGKSNIDIGCFQLNLRWHAENFTSLEEMFDPTANANYAAQYLQQNFARKGNWVDAVAAYHSNTPEHAETYIAKVEAVLTDLSQETLPVQPDDSLPANKPNLFPLLKQGVASSMASLVPQTDSPMPFLIATP